MNTNRLALVLTILNLALLVFLLAWGRTVVSPAAGDVLRAQRIELVDEQGQARAKLNLEASGEVVFRLLDETGTIRVKLGASEGGSGLVLLNDLTEPGLQLLAEEGGARLTLIEHDGAQRVIEP